MFKETGSIEEVAKYIQAESSIGLFDDVTPYLESVQPPSSDAVKEKISSIRSESDPT